jgi:hypothetical protein
MKTNSRCQSGSRLAGERGAVLVVVLIVMVALLGLGMTGLFLTSSSIQMNTNINLRNQALVIAEAGIERARMVLNYPYYTPPIPTFLTQNNGAGGEVPANTSQCDGQLRGAILIDPVSDGCTSTPHCLLSGVTYPSLDRRINLPSSAGTVSMEALGKYTVYVRQDMADCRMGNFVCDMSPATAIDAGIGGSFGVTTCAQPVGAPTPNGAIVVRSEGLASDNRTRVVLEVTMTPAQGLQKPQSTPMSALCSAGVNGCDDNSSVQNGIVVNSKVPQAPPSTGGTESGGTGGTGGVASTGGTVGSTTVPGTGVGGSTGGTVTSGGTSGTGGQTGNGGASGTGGSTNCKDLTCPRIATMGLTGLETSTQFLNWLANHSSKCVRQDLQVESNCITDQMLQPYQVVIVLDVDHLPIDYVNFANLKAQGKVFDATLAFINPSKRNRQFNSGSCSGRDEDGALLRWVQNGGGLVLTQGYGDNLNIIRNANVLAEAVGLVFSSPDCGLDPNCAVCPSCAQKTAWTQNAYGVYDITNFTAHPVTQGMTNLYASGYWPISGYYSGSLVNLPNSVYQVIATGGCLNCSNTNRTLNFMVAGQVGSGHVVAVGDEWLTFDKNMNVATNAHFWDNTMTWLIQCH